MKRSGEDSKKHLFKERLDATTDSFDLMSEPPRCCICLDEFTSPTTLPCGHVFCLECIGEYWRISDVCQCPLCKADFPERLELKTNQTLQSLAKTVPLRVGEVPCDFCSEEQAAVRSCLTCLASYCTAHLQPHYQTEDLRRHQLINVMKNFDDAVCRMHERPLGLFCKSDQTCICTKCAEKDHRGHRVISVNREAAKKKGILKRRRSKLQQEIHTRRSKVHEIKLSEDISGESPQAAWMPNTKLLEQLEGELTELQEKSTELEQLLQTEDNLLFLQRFLHP